MTVQAGDQGTEQVKTNQINYDQYLSGILGVVSPHLPGELLRVVLVSFSQC